MDQVNNETKIEIILNQNGGIRVKGPIHNKLLCYGMLECARDLIKDNATNKVDLHIPDFPGDLEGL